MGVVGRGQYGTGCGSAQEGEAGRGGWNYGEEHRGGGSAGCRGKGLSREANGGGGVTTGRELGWSTERWRVRREEGKGAWERRRNQGSVAQNGHGEINGAFRGPGDRAVLHGGAGEGKGADKDGETCGEARPRGGGQFEDKDGGGWKGVDEGACGGRRARAGKQGRAKAGRQGGGGGGG
ncbi:hypothetical protein WJX73_010656 [Symbiochloris irregularis]|uniref:Uncharacterized protein n=1 Tax=Symbiochloris irregularis TaxID=706552 RepID=A0AAW1NLA0_9CHLO